MTDLQRDPLERREQLKRSAKLRGEAVRRRLSRARQALIGGVAVATCGLAVLIDVISPADAGAASSTSASSSTASGHGDRGADGYGYGGYGAGGYGYGGYGSDGYGSGDNGPGGYGYYGGTAPEASSGAGSATSGGS